MDDTSKELRNYQLALMAAMKPDERLAFGCEMFMTARESIFRSLPANLSHRERTARYFEQMYDQPIPADFFRDDEL
jgi:hypothetical protein